MIDKEKLKKDNFYIINNGLGPVKAKLLESPKQGRGWKNSVLMYVYGSTVGFFDEPGGVYVKDIIEVC